MKKAKIDGIKLEKLKGHGPGGQRKNKVETACRATHIETGITVFIQDQRTYTQNKKIAINKLKEAVEQHYKEIKDKKKKEHRDYKIHNTKTIRTYDYKNGTVKDHRTGKTASLKDVLEKGKVDLLK